MPIVSDTSPILGLSAIDYLGLLQDQFEEVFIPQAVLAELKIETDFRGTDVIEQALNDGWLKPRESGTLFVHSWLQFVDGKTDGKATIHEWGHE